MMAAPSCLPDFIWLLSEAASRGWPVLVLGSGSNLLVHDEGVGALAVDERPALQRVEPAEGGWGVGAGVSLTALATQADQAGLAGLEFSPECRAASAASA